MLNVLLLQLPVPNNPGANIPLAAGYLKAWAHQLGLLDRVSIELMPRDIADRAGDALLVHEIVRRRHAQLGLSLDTWNSERSLSIAATVKRRLPDLTVIVGGPEVQRNNDWILHHPAVDIAVDGEGEQTFGELLLRMVGGSAARQAAWTVGDSHLAIPLGPATDPHAPVAGTIQPVDGGLLVAPPRVALSSLDAVPSPYLLGFLELRPGEMALVECSRWCPYGCTFCLYGRNLGTKLGGRLFGAARILAEVAWVKAQGAGAIHFVEANLNLLPIFPELMAGLKPLNAVDPVSIYAELRGEHLKDEVVLALVEAGLHTAEVGLQSANRSALQAVGRRTDLDKWAEGTRRLYQRGVQVLLDVILGLPEDDRDSTLATLDWITEQQLGPYDIFTLQVLPGTGIRNDAERYALRYQDRPPYYVLSTHKLSYSELRGLRWELREAAGLDPQIIEGLPEPAAAVWDRPAAGHFHSAGWPIQHIQLDCAAELSLAEWAALGLGSASEVASHVVVVAHNSDLAVIEALCWPIAQANPTIHWDIILDDPQLAAKPLRELTERWPHEIGYLDRIAVYRRPVPEPAWSKVSPRWWMLADWQADCDPLRFEGVAEMVWRVPAAQIVASLPDLLERGGTGVVIAGILSREERQLVENSDLRVLNW
jgi:radical SAM superfamily enzyme YgiQ (UPF0313 family)